MELLQAARGAATAISARPTPSARWSSSTAPATATRRSTYDKGGWVFWMLLQHMGRERDAGRAAASSSTDWSDRPDHPVLQDFLAAMRPFAPDPAAYDAFAQQWFLQVVVPEYRLTGARKTAGAASAWEVTVRVENAGTGRMPVEVAAARGERFTDDGKPGSRLSRRARARSSSARARSARCASPAPSSPTGSSSIPTSRCSNCGERQP